MPRCIFFLPPAAPPAGAPLPAGDGCAALALRAAGIPAIFWHIVCANLPIHTMGVRNKVVLNYAGPRNMAVKIACHTSDLQ